MYKRYIEACSYNHCGRAKARSIIYIVCARVRACVCVVCVCVCVCVRVCVCVCVVCNLSYPARKEHVPYYTVICGLSGSTIFFHIIRNQHDFRGGGGNGDPKMCILMLSTALV